MIQKKTLIAEKVADYVKDQLEQGKTLSERLAKTNFLSGRFFSYLPDTLSEERVYQFRYGGLVTTLDEPRSWSQVVEYIQSYLKGDSRRICLFEDGVAKVSDPSIKDDTTSPHLFFEDEVYSFVTSNSQDISTQLEAAIRAANSGFLMNGILSRLPEDLLTLAIRGYLNSQQLDFLIEKAHSVLIEAYDGESVVIWESD